MIWKFFSVSTKEMHSGGTQVDKRLPPLKEKRENINTWQKDNRLDSTGHHKPKDKEISLKNFPEQSLWRKGVLGAL